MRNKLYIPLMNTSITAENRADYVKALQACDADHVFLGFPRSSFTAFDGNAEIGMRENVRVFREAGFDTCVWITSFGYGATLMEADADLSDEAKKRLASYTPMRSVTGKETGDAYCPECENFMKDYLDYVTYMVNESNTRMLMIDDDLCLSVRPGIGCFCEHHIRLLEEELGESLLGKDLPTLFFTGKTNRYRKAWEKVQGDTLRRFARRVRETVDKIDPTIRIGFCSGVTNWDIEGVDALELAKIFAGNTKPFLRFYGAPYWVSRAKNRYEGQTLHSVNELSRVQEKWCRDSGVEVFVEGDPYPRPRYMVPASLLECYDVAVTATGGVGSLKYMFDYCSSLEYEKGYVKHHMKNLPLQKFIHEHFDDKLADGVYVVEKMHKFSDMPLPEEFMGEEELMMMSQPAAAAMLSILGIPVSYEENNEIAMAFNENVNGLTTLPKKLILDVKAAMILEEKGVDTGLASWKLTSAPQRERTERERIQVSSPVADYYECELKPGAVVKGYFETDRKSFPAVYTYYNGTTEFLVMTFDGYTPLYNSSLFTSYLRQQQLIEFIGDRFCYIKNEPGIYQICKRGNGETAVLFENIWEDLLFDFSISLDDEYREVSMYGATGYLDGKNLRITSEVAPYGMVAIVLSK